MSGNRFSVGLRGGGAPGLLGGSTLRLGVGFGHVVARFGRCCYALYIVFARMLCVFACVFWAVFRLRMS